MDEKVRPVDVRGGAGHQVNITNREHLAVVGVVGVESFDDQEIILATELGTLTIRGEELHIKQLDLESGRFAVTGTVNALIYSQRPVRSGRPGRSRGFLERLLR